MERNERDIPPEGEQSAEQKTTGRPEQSASEREAIQFAVSFRANLREATVASLKPFPEEPMEHFKGRQERALHAPKLRPVLEFKRTGKETHPSFYFVLLEGEHSTFAPHDEKGEADYGTIWDSFERARAKSEKGAIEFLEHAKRSALIPHQKKVEALRSELETLQNEVANDREENKRADIEKEIALTERQLENAEHNVERAKEFLETFEPPHESEHAEEPEHEIPETKEEPTEFEPEEEAQFAEQEKARSSEMSPPKESEAIVHIGPSPRQTEYIGNPEQLAALARERMKWLMRRLNRTSDPAEQAEIRRALKAHKATLDAAREFRAKRRETSLAPFLEQSEPQRPEPPERAKQIALDLLKYGVGGSGALLNRSAGVVLGIGAIAGYGALWLGWKFLKLYPKFFAWSWKEITGKEIKIRKDGEKK